MPDWGEEQRARVFKKQSAVRGNGARDNLQAAALAGALTLGAIGLGAATVKASEHFQQPPSDPSKVPNLMLAPQHGESYNSDTPALYHENQSNLTPATLSTETNPPNKYIPPESPEDSPHIIQMAPQGESFGKTPAQIAEERESQHHGLFDNTLTEHRQAVADAERKNDYELSSEDAMKLFMEFRADKSPNHEEFKKAHPDIPVVENREAGDHQLNIRSKPSITGSVVGEIPAKQPLLNSGIIVAHDHQYGDWVITKVDDLPQAVYYNLQSTQPAKENPQTS